MSDASGASSLRSQFRWLARTPLHPQWLLATQDPGPRLRQCRGTVLDIGAANRWLALHLPEDTRYIAFDYPTTAVGMYGCRPDVFGDAHRLPFADATIDAVACFEVLEHTRDPDAVLAEIARVLKPGGFAELSMPFLYPVHDAPYDFQRWTVHGWERSGSRCGLEVERLQPTNSALQASAVLACLALAAPAAGAHGLRRLLLLALLGPLVLAINLAATMLGWFWPEWPALTTSYRVTLRKPQ